jgi:transposase
MEHIVQLPPCLIGIEACAGSFYWQRRFSEHGHPVKTECTPEARPSARGSGHTLKVVALRRMNCRR